MYCGVQSVLLYTFSFYIMNYVATCYVCAKIQFIVMHSVSFHNLCYDGLSYSVCRARSCDRKQEVNAAWLQLTF